MADAAVFHASEGAQLHTLAVDRGTGRLERRHTLALPEIVQYGAYDRAHRRLYLSLSDRTARHMVIALDTGGSIPSLYGDPLPLDERAIHLDVDGAAGHIVLAHPESGRLSLISLHPDGRMKPLAAAGGAAREVARVGFFAHQALFDPAGGGLVACVMGADAAGAAPEKPGRLAAFRYAGGALHATGDVTLGAGLGPRHLAYAHGRVYVVVERGNRLAVLGYRDRVVEGNARFLVSTLADPAAARPGQRAGAIGFHPNRRWLYVTNRGGDVNDIALFAVDEATGEPVVRGHFASGGHEPRTFAIDPGGAFLVVANHSPGPAAPRRWASFRIGGDGRLDAVDALAALDGDLFWIGSAAPYNPMCP